MADSLRTPVGISGPLLSETNAPAPMSDLSIVAVTSEDLDAAQAWWNSTDGLRTAEFHSLAQAFARFGASEAERVREACAKVARAHRAPKGVPQIDYDQACDDIEAGIYSLATDRI